MLERVSLYIDLNFPFFFLHKITALDSNPHSHALILSFFIEVSPCLISGATLLFFPIYVTSKHFPFLIIGNGTIHDLPAMYKDIKAIDYENRHTSNLVGFKIDPMRAMSKSQV